MHLRAVWIPLSLFSLLLAAAAAGCSSTREDVVIFADDGLLSVGPGVKDEAIAIKILMAITDTAEAEGYTRVNDRHWGGSVTTETNSGVSSSRTHASAALSRWVFANADGQEVRVEHSSVEGLDHRVLVDADPATSERFIDGVWGRVAPQLE